MNTWLSWWRTDERPALALRALLRRGTRLSHHLFSIVGGCAVLLALAIWLLPTWRGTLAARVMPFVSAAVQAGPARLLQGNPLPSVAPPGGKLADDTFADSENANGVTPTAALADAATTDTTSSTMPMVVGVAPLNGLAPQSLPSVSVLARMIPSERITPDARDDRVLVSAREQALVATYIARRYHVAQEPVGDLVRAAFDTGREVGLDPLLLLAVMAIESGFNPYAESGVGAQGLMQVMAKVHSDKLQYFGGQSAALDPLANIKVGALVLKDCIARGGSLPGGLRLYNGSTASGDGGYGAKVMAERARLRDAAHGGSGSIAAPQATTTVSAPVPQRAPRRVQVTLDGARPLAEKTAAAPSKASEEDEANLNSTKHASATDIGA
ncbi:MAG TPA: transglycosylase SLT domain-containing protein [Paraburkholderia sp.]|jgi:soluble lytic murein transglycosylase-like protein|nr:transglycosylase SLT domain-containing protein [Paraburkholderia sp.]